MVVCVAGDAHKGGDHDRDVRDNKTEAVLGNGYQDCDKNEAAATRSHLDYGRDEDLDAAVPEDERSVDE